MKYAKIREVKSPTRGKSIQGDRSAGLDFYVPEYSDKFVEDLFKENKTIEVDVIDGQKDSKYSHHYIKLNPHQNVQIPSGIKVNIRSVKGFHFDEHNALKFEAANKSSISKCKHLDVGATIVDEDYQGEIHISLTNTSSSYVYVAFGEKIAQFILVPIILSEPEEVDEEELYDGKSIRREGRYGSTSHDYKVVLNR